MRPQSAELASAEMLFGARLPLAERYAALLADTGIGHGLLGPQERLRIWSRHLLNCAAAAELLPRHALVVDVGSGAGLPGIPLAIARPDVDIVLVEPLLRRTTWLVSALHDLGLDAQVRVHRGRAQEAAGAVSGDVVTARAVAPLATVAAWCLPLLARGGQILALKGSSAAVEAERDAAALAALGVTDVEILTCGDGTLDPPTTVVRLRATGRTAGRSAPSRPDRGRGRTPARARKH